ncbi:hypothetical protein Xsto_04135 [Xenorhabdus stockiae]|uniref:Uncharacterized protein n=1 Tax=Xenorhabdus stockiae TaxID=351614 RepID=A0A2D0K4C5_9GAMM|nr:hypothetical protein [Xenorhabdus stockiae]PHM56857.1 hypothetical protein Xsto_04135 [Xenorhabdus stockiae]
MKFEIKNIKNILPLNVIEVEVDIYTDENDRNDFTAWVELPYSETLSLGEIKEQAVEIAKGKFKKASGQM